MKMYNVSYGEIMNKKIWETLLGKNLKEVALLTI